MSLRRSLLEHSGVPRVLIVDDDPTSGLCLEGLLRQEGFSTMKAMNGPQARTLACREKPDLILLDIQMPGESGLETCVLLKQHPITADIPIIFLTSEEELATKVKGFGLGAVDYITKPYHPVEVLARIRVHIRLRRAMLSIIESQVESLQELSATQKLILPAPEHCPEAHFSVCYRPFHEAGGDFYDVVSGANDVFDYVTADVSGHDLGSSLATAALKALLMQGRAMLSTPMETMRMINQVLLATFGGELYVTLAWARLNRRRRTLTTISAGHPPAILIRASGADELLPCSGDVLGIFETIGLDEQVTKVQYGDRLYLYTDGVLDLFGQMDDIRTERLRQMMASCCAAKILPLAQAVDRIAADAGKDKTCQDDILLLGVEV